MLKKILIGLATLGLAGLLIASSSSVGRTGTVARTGAPTIALVNEDEAASFNGTDYLFGKEFVSLVSNDTRYNWQVVSRGVAEKAYSDQAVSAVIVLPRSFSRDILTLQDIDPTKAQVDYRVAAGDQLSEQRLQNELFTVLRDFNTRVVEMYFASVAGNLSGAQVGMETVVDRYSKLLGTLTDDLQPRVGKTGEDYKRTGSLAEILRSMNSAWIQAQNGFTSSTTGTLTSISESLAARQPDLTDYFALQEQIAKTNLLNGNAAIGDQAASDSDYFRQAFADHIEVLRSGDGTWSGLDGLRSVDADGNPAGALADLQKTVADYDRLAVDYNAKVGEVVGSLHQQDGALATSSRALGDLATRLLHEYFGIDGTDYDSVDLSDPGLGDPRTALAEKIANSFAAGSSRSSTADIYKAELVGLIRGISTDPARYSDLFDSLEATTDFRRGPYLSQLALIDAYARENGIASPALNAVRTTRAATDQTVAKTLPVTVPAGDAQQVHVILPGTLKPSDVTVTVASPSGTQPSADRTTVDPSTNAVTVDNTQGSEPLTVVLSYAIDLHDLAGDTLVEYTATSTGTLVPEVHDLGSDRYVLVPASAAAGTVADNFSSTTSYLGQITTATTLLRFLYGAPGEDEAAFTAAVLADGRFDAHSTASVYNRYGVIDAGAIKGQLSDSDVNAYRRLGVDNVTAILEQLHTVEAAQKEIQRDIESLETLRLSPSYFTDTLQQLEAWYAAAITSVNAAPELWSAKSNTVIQLSTTAWSGQKPGRSELYLDESTGPALYKTLTQLVESSSSNAQAVAASAHLIDDNSAQFDDLIAGVQRTQAETDTLLGTMNGTIAADTAGAAESSAFSSRFSTVLSNTRATGADPAKIYETFANPVTAKDTTPAAKSTRGDGFDYRWIAIFVAGSLVGGLVAALVARRKRRTHGAGKAGA